MSLHPHFFEPKKQLNGRVCLIEQMENIFVVVRIKDGPIQNQSLQCFRLQKLSFGQAILSIGFPVIGLKYPVGSETRADPHASQ